MTYAEASEWKDKLASAGAREVHINSDRRGGFWLDMWAMIEGKDQSVLVFETQRGAPNLLQTLTNHRRAFL